MDLLYRFQDFIRKEKLFGSESRLLLAVSGGLDSVVLCALCQEARFDYIIAHANFQLRGLESERDEAFVRNLGEKYGREVIVRKFETGQYASEKKISIQLAARELRYAWFHELTGVGQLTVNGRLEKACDWIVTAHHQDDNVETLLMHFFRGTGISGLRGMLPRQDRVIRPLLFASKEALMNYAVSKELTWVEDSSNTGDYYSRNYFRHQVIPLVSKIFPEALGNLSGNLSRFREIELLYNQSILRHKKRLLSRKGEEIHIPVLKLRQSEPLSTIIYEIIREYGFTSSQTGEVMDLLEKDTGKYILSPEYRIIKNRNWLIIAPRNTELAETILIEEGQKHVQGPGFRIELSLFSAGQSALSTERSIAQIDAGEISFPLILRKWKPGDYFYPLGMRKKKKIARFLIDNKLSLLNKEKTWVIEANRKIIWIVGMRIDDRFRVTARTEKVLNIEMRVT